MRLFAGTLDITSRFLPGEGVGKNFRAEIHKNAAKPPFNYFEAEEEDEVTAQIDRQLYLFGNIHIHVMALCYVVEKLWSL